MPKYEFIRTAPLIVTVEAKDEKEAWVQSGNRLDDFFTDVCDGRHESHDDEHPGTYSITYHGDAVYVNLL